VRNDEADLGRAALMAVRAEHHTLKEAHAALKERMAQTLAEGSELWPDDDQKTLSRGALRALEEQIMQLQEELKAARGFADDERHHRNTAEQQLDEAITLMEKQVAGSKEKEAELERQLALANQMASRREEEAAERVAGLQGMLTQLHADLQDAQV
jgi:hypothetical protein